MLGYPYMDPLPLIIEVGIFMDVFHFWEGIIFLLKREQNTDFSVVLFRPHFMLASEEYPMKVHKNQWLSAPLSSTDLPCGATNQGTHPGVWDAAAFPVT